MNHFLCLTLALSASIITPVAHAASGETWEVTTKTEMSGMPYAMPDSTATVCAAKGAEKDPRKMVNQQGDCTMTDIKTSGNKTTWKMSCDNDGQTMTGTGEVVYSTDSYQGVTRLSGTEDGEKMDMTASYRGKRIGTSCDPSAAPVVAMQGMENMNDMMGMAKSQMAGAMAEQCEVSRYESTELMTSRFFGPDASCPGREKFACKVIVKDVGKKTEAYIALAKHDDTSDVSIAKTCGIDMAETTKAICKKVDSGNYHELEDYCPSEAATFAAAEHNDSTSGSGSSTGDTVGNVLDNAKKLKGLFGF